MFFIYNLVFLIYGLFYLPYLLATGRWHRDFGQRFGIFSGTISQALRAKPNIWIHAVSVGEVAAIERLIHQIKERWPKHNVVCSVTTKTGYELAKKRLSGHALVIAAPLDLSGVVHTFVGTIKPEIYIVAETEIWPNLFTRLNKAKVPIVLINGRISDQSYSRYLCVRGLLKGILVKVNVFAMQSTLDAKRITTLGADPTCVKVAGNIKFDGAIVTQAQAVLKDLPQPLWIAGSTHPGEEEIVLEVFKKLPENWRLALAPRHVERSDEVMALIARTGLTAVKFSQLKSTQEYRVIVVDTIGHLQSLYGQAELVFVGKSLCVGGGHNVIEPAFFAKPIVIGSRTENFRDIVACFKAQDALVEVHDAKEFEEAIKALAVDETKRRALGQRARGVIEQNQGAAARVLHFIERAMAGA